MRFVLFLLFTLSYDLRAAVTLCDTREVTSSEISFYEKQFDISKGYLFYDCEAVFFDEIKLLENQKCYFDKYVPYESSPIKIGRYWGEGASCSDWKNQGFLFFKEIDSEENVGQVYDFWKLFKKNKVKFLFSEINWIKRSFYDEFRGFFNSIDGELTSIVVHDTVTRDPRNEHTYMFSFQAKGSSWLLEVYFGAKAEIIRISEVVI